MAGIEKIGSELLQKCPHLKVISRNGVGIDNIDKVTAEKMGIALRITPGANSRGVAELTIGLLFSLIRSITQTNISVKSGAWDRTKGIEIQGKTLGVIGTGMIGREVISITSGMGINILTFDPYPNKSLNEINNVKYTSLEKLFTESDIITLHCPARESPLINKEMLSIAKKGVYIINTARDSLVDDSALLKALNNGTVSGYAVDTFAKEPPDMTALLEHPAVILTAHIGGFTEESIYRTTRAAVQNIIEVLGK